MRVSHTSSTLLSNFESSVSTNSAIRTTGKADNDHRSLFCNPVVSPLLIILRTKISFRANTLHHPYRVGLMFFDFKFRTLPKQFILGIFVWLGFSLSKVSEGTIPISSPTEIPNLRFWVDAGNIDESNNSTLSNGDAVSTWKDLSGNGNHLFSAGTTHKPIYVTDGVFPHAITAQKGKALQYMRTAVTPNVDLLNLDPIDPAVSVFMVRKDYPRNHLGSNNPHVMTYTNSVNGDDLFRIYRSPYNGANSYKFIYWDPSPIQTSHSLVVLL